MRKVQNNIKKKFKKLESYVFFKVAISDLQVQIQPASKPKLNSQPTINSSQHSIFPENFSKDTFDAYNVTRMACAQVIFPGARRWTDLRYLGDDGEYYGPPDLEYIPRPGDIIYYGPGLQVKVPEDKEEVVVDSIIFSPPRQSRTQKRRTLGAARSPTKSSERKRREKYKPQQLLHPRWR